MHNLFKTLLRARRGPALLLSVGRLYTRDAAQAFQYRMPAGFPGEINRSHPVSIEPASMDADNPPLEYGVAVVIDATSKRVRRLAAGDTALTDVYGFVARPHPTQQMTTSNFGSASFGGDGPGTVNKCDVMRSGYMVVKLNNPAAAPSAKGGQVHIWVAATSGVHVQGRMEAAASGGNTMSLAVGWAMFNGSPDADGNVELCFRP